MSAWGLPRAESPEQIGLSSARLERAAQVIREDVERKLIPGAVLAIARGGRVGFAETFGWRDREAGAKMTADSIFRVASMTKPMTTVAAMMLAEEGSLEIAAPVAQYLPEFAELTVGVERRQGAAHDERAGSDAPHLGADLRGIRRLAGADDLARRKADGRGPDQCRPRRQARPAPLDVRTGHDLGIQHVDRCPGARRRGGVRQIARRILRRAHHRARSAWRIPGLPRPGSAPGGSPRRRSIRPPESGRRCATSPNPGAGIRAAAARSRPPPIICGSARCC